MRNLTLKRYVRILLFLLLYYGYGQDANHESSLLIKYDQMLGPEKTSLYKGILYTQKYRMQEDNHMFFKSYHTLIGALTYDHQPYYRQKIKYDIVQDQIIITLKNSLNRDNVLIINKSKVSSMIIDRHRFVRTDAYMPKTDTYKINSFLEILLESNDITFLKSHKKSIRETIKNRSILRKFVIRTAYFLHVDNTFYRIKSRKHILKIFREYKSELRAIRKGTQLLSNDEELFLYMLKRVEVLQNQNKETEVRKV